MDDFAKWLETTTPGNGKKVWINTETGELSHKNPKEKVMKEHNGEIVKLTTDLPKMFSTTMIQDIH